MDSKHYSPTPDATYVPSEPGFLVPSRCGRTWFVPLEAVGRDYAEFLEQVDKLSPAEATTKAEKNRDFWPTWFAEQCDHWTDVDRLGTLVGRSQRYKTKSALDRARGAYFQDYDEVDIPKD